MTPDELPELSLEFRCSGRSKRSIPVPTAFTIGVHGLVVEQGVRRGLLLPQVATEWGWTAEQFLRQTCVKAGLPPDAWQHGARVFRFAAEVFGGLMPRLGAHLSIAGGLPRAVDRAVATRCEALQIFTKSAGQWRARVLPPDEIVLFRRRVAETGIQPVVAHNSYLINIAAAAPRAARSSRCAALGEELRPRRRARPDGLVMHPGLVHDRHRSRRACG